MRKTSLPARRPGAPAFHQFEPLLETANVDQQIGGVRAQRIGGAIQTLARRPPFRSA